MRAYTIVNMYMAGIHAGIQSAHILTEMALASLEADSQESKTFQSWAKNDKTLIVLNGGSNQNLRKMMQLIEPACRELELPFAAFHESQEALDGALTGFGLIVPSRIYDSKTVDSYDFPESKIASCLNLLNLAR